MISCIRYHQDSRYSPLRLTQANLEDAQREVAKQLDMSISWPIYYSKALIFKGWGEGITSVKAKTHLATSTPTYAAVADAESPTLG